MGISIFDAALLASVISQHSIQGRVVCLGVPRIAFTSRKLADLCAKVRAPWHGPKTDEVMTPAAFFKQLGFEAYEALDVSDYEGATIIHNLNEPTLAEAYKDRADCIVDCGTLEHVFNIPAALQVIGALLKERGIVVHLTPCNGYLDHGFYQVCPTLFHDYYAENKYRLLSASLVNRYKQFRAVPYTQDVYRNGGALFGVEDMRRSTNFFVAQKTNESTSGKVPTQGFYKQVHVGDKHRNFVESGFRFSLARGRLRRWLSKPLRLLQVR